ncbi:MAG TPA: metalloregulator ArsR/SmtB family transcription factor [Candidatus Dormibacteraeota bacterium]|nr:metalloregulator ArsR/SmtB family transcription factor [Candidatus Dormibacteraeota bacterium]
MATIELPERERGRCCAVELPVDPASARRTAELLKALADPTRLAMVWCLWRARAPLCVCDFTASFGLGQPTISHHMARLREAGLVEAEKRGIWTYYRLREDLEPATVSLIEALWWVATGAGAGSATRPSVGPPPSPPGPDPAAAQV